MTLIAAVPTPIPLAFNVNGGYEWTPNPVTSVAFTIPAGTYVSGFWTISNSWAGAPVGGAMYIGVVQTTETFDLLYDFSDTPTGSVTNAECAVSAGNLTAINTAAGTTINVVLSTAADGGAGSVGPITLLTLTLVPTGIGGAPVSFTVEQTNQSTTGCATFLVQLLDASGNAANAGGSGQVISFAPYLNSNLAGGALTIGSTSSSGTFTACSKQSGIFTVQVCPGAGTLSAVACQTINGSFYGAATDPNAARCAIYRPNIRDAVRMNLGIATPLSNGTGYAGDETPGQRYPTNDVLNASIADALRFINTECNLHMTNDIPIAIVGNASQIGPLIIPLAGVQGCPQSLSINTIRRCRFVDTAGNITTLTATSYWEIDKNRWSYDNVPAANPPRWYMVDGYKLILLPAPAVPGTLFLYAGTAMQNFAGDSDTIDELPSDHQLTMEWLATGFTCLKKPDEPNNMAQFNGYMELAKPGVKNIKRFFQLMNEAYQPSVSADVGRRMRVR